MLTTIALLLLGAASETQPASQPRPTELAALAAQLETRAVELQLPSLALRILQDDAIMLEVCSGLADREQQRAATPDTLYRIGSITKVFTATLMAALRDDGVLRLDDALTAHVPQANEIKLDPRGAATITLRHLATHSSGLPAMTRPGLADVARFYDPVAGWSREKLLAGVSGIELAAPVGDKVIYSNLGYGLLGLALEGAAAAPYYEILQRRILTPLEMSSTVLQPDAGQARRTAVGYTGPGFTRPRHHEALGVLAPAGELYGSLADLTRFMQLQLRAGRELTSPLRGGTLRELHTPQRLMPGWRMAVALGWHVEPDRRIGEIVWHNGALTGWRAFVGFSPRQRVAVIALTNCDYAIDELARQALVDAVLMLAVQADPRLQEVANALAAGIAENPPDALSERFAPDFLRAIPWVKVQAMLKDLHARYGASVRHTVLRGDETNSAEIHSELERGRLLVTLQLEPAPGSKIVGINFEPRP